MNVGPPKHLSIRQSKAIYPLSTICANNASLDKGPDREFTSAGIMTRRTSRLGRCQLKKKICQQNNVSRMLPTTETLEEALQKIEVEHKRVKWRKRHENASILDKNYVNE